MRYALPLLLLCGCWLPDGMSVGVGRSLNSGRGLVTSNLDTTTSAGWSDATTNSSTSSDWDAGNSTSGWVEFQWDFDPVEVQSIPTYVPHQHVEEVMPSDAGRRLDGSPETEHVTPPPGDEEAASGASGGDLSPWWLTVLLPFLTLIDKRVQGGVGHVCRAMVPQLKNKETA